MSGGSPVTRANVACVLGGRGRCPRRAGETRRLAQIEMRGLRDIT